MQLLRLDGVTVLNDTYNANPDSVMAALATLLSARSTGKKIAVLADMLELGSDAAEEHRRIGQAAEKYGIEYLLTFGTLAKHIHDAATTKFKAHYDQKNVLSEYLAELLTEGDIVLIKGSRGMKMEDVVAFLTERFKQGENAAGQAA
jgi:UDP-N-acetylmuramoyl-tripeptide--D-alanyl-D-alanine ligase